MSGRVVRRAYKFRCYPTPEQAEQLAQTFGCVRYVYNRALAERSRAWTQEQRRVTHAETDRMLTGWKRDPETAWLAEPSKGPLQAALRHLQGAFDTFWRKQNRYPRFKKKGKSRDSATYFRIHARIADRRRDHLHKLTTRLVRENQVIVIEDLSVRNMVKNRSVARAISDASWSDLRRMLEYKADWYGREVVAIDRWYPSSKTCSDCGHLMRAMPLKVRDWT